MFSSNIHAGAAWCYNEGNIKKAPAKMTTFSHFCPEHIGMLIFIAIAITIGLLLIRRSPEKNARRIVLILSLITLAGEALQDILLVSEGGNILDFLPLHLCNLGIFVNLLASLTHGKVRSYFAEVSLVLILPGAIGALLFPDWTYRPFWSYLPMLCFLTHSLLVFIPLIFLVRKDVRVSFKHFWYSYLFLAIAAPPIYLLDRAYGQDYLFLMYPTRNSPLEWIYNITCEKYYLAGLLGLVTIMLLIVYTVCLVINRGRKK